MKRMRSDANVEQVSKRQRTREPTEKHGAPAAGLEELFEDLVWELARNLDTASDYYALARTSKHMAALLCSERFRAPMERTVCYAVKKGRETGIFGTWDEASRQVTGFAGARFGKFESPAAAKQWLDGPSNAPVRPERPHANLKRTRGPEKTDPLARYAGMMHVYCDGAAPFNGTPLARAGIGVFFGPDDPRNVSARLGPEYKQTNQVAEIMAALKAVELTRDLTDKPVVIITDSAYVVVAMNAWRHAWIAGGWRRKLENKDALRRLSDAVDACLPRPTYFVHVRGHGKCEGNIQADMLATAGARHEAQQ